ncbi:MAG TPA: RodZ domain-containing protein, partial [Burkholderiales bacterium]|nr:RodZ domain-containing protein [Burkholderiales bacterium]
AFDRLPGPAFVRGMVRAYARAVDLDTAPLLARLAPVSSEPVDSLAVFVNQPVPITERSQRMNALYGVLSVVFAVMIGVVAWEWWMQKADGERMTFVKPAQTLRAREPAAVTVAATQFPTAVASVAVETAPQSPVRESAEPVRENTQPVRESTQPGRDSATPARESTPAGDGTRRIGLRFERDAWVQIKAGDGRVLISGVNGAGSERTVEGRPPFAVVIGNAHHVRLNYEDKPVDLAPHLRSDVARLTLE